VLSRGGRLGSGAHPVGRMGHEPFTWLAGLGSAANVGTSAIIFGVILAFAAYVRPRLASAEAAGTPESRVTARSLAETFTEAMSSLAESVIGNTRSATFRSSGASSSSS